MTKQFFEDAYTAGKANWDTGRPQPAILELARDGAIKGTILDAGCGTGENALALAAHGKVVGVDASPTAILAARHKAQVRGLPVVFLVRDLTRPTGLRYHFDTVVDSGLFHGLDEAGRAGYVHQLMRLVVPGGLVHILAFGGDNDPAGPPPLAASDLEQALGSRFRLNKLRKTRFALRSSSRTAWLATYERHTKEKYRRRRPLDW